MGSNSTKSGIVFLLGVYMHNQEKAFFTHCEREEAYKFEPAIMHVNLPTPRSKVRPAGAHTPAGDDRAHKSHAPCGVPPYVFRVSEKK